MFSREQNVRIELKRYYDTIDFSLNDFHWIHRIYWGKLSVAVKSNLLCGNRISYHPSSHRYWKGLWCNPSSCNIGFFNLVEIREFKKSIVLFGKNYKKLIKSTDRERRKSANFSKYFRTHKCQHFQILMQGTKIYG